MQADIDLDIWPPPELVRRRGDEGAVNVGLWVVGEGMAEDGDGRFFGDNAPDAVLAEAVEIWGGFVGFMTNRSGGGGEAAFFFGGGVGMFCSWSPLMCLPLCLSLFLSLSLYVSVSVSVCLPVSLSHTQTLFRTLFSHSRGGGGGGLISWLESHQADYLHVIRIVRDVAVTRSGRLV